MQRDDVVRAAGLDGAYAQLCGLHAALGDAFRDRFDRSLPFTDELFDRWARARALGFGEGASIYDSAYVFGDVHVGEGTWIGPFTVIDGSGGLTIGSHCTLSAGVHVYTHDNVKRTLSGGRLPIEHAPVAIGDRTYLAPHVVVRKGVTIGAGCVVGAGSYVHRDLPDGAIAVGTPARVVGRVVVEGDDVHLTYFDRP